MAALLMTLLATGASYAQREPDPLRAGFQNPPQSARPRVWWHWMNGNITEEGITLDLEWMHRIGIAGFQAFDAALSTPQVVDKRLAYMTPEWQHAFKHAAALGAQLGLEEAIAGSPGWSESGGPWVPPAQGMKKYVWSETVVDGGTPFKGVLRHPPSNTGPFQNLDGGDFSDASRVPHYYADALVVAYRTAASDVPLASLHPKITVSGGAPNIAQLTDGDFNQTVDLPAPPVGESAWIQYELAQPTAIRAVTIATRDPDPMTALVTRIGIPEKRLEVSLDGHSFQEVARLPEGGAPEHTVSFPPITAKLFRVTFKRTPPPPLPPWAQGMDRPAGAQAAPVYRIAELVLHPGARVNRFEEKAAFVPATNLYALASPQVSSPDAIPSAEVIDLTAKLHADGTLDWTPPPGQWTVLRFGYSLLGITNHPATAEATGLEVDKLDRHAVQHYMEAYLDSYRKAVGPELIGEHGIHYVINDSWEAGSQNWTDGMLEQFRTRRGYDPRPWMPVLAGKVVQSAAASDRFLWDFRKTIADLIADEHYGQLESTLHAWHMAHYGESHESGRAFAGDGMEVKKLDEIPMSAMWTQQPGVNLEQFGFNADDRESASVAHIYGQNLAAAESMTAAAAPWGWSPATLKPTADQEFLNGINRIVIHESAHQPLVGKAPGLTLGPFGQWFNRNDTWAEQAGPWIDYLARTSFLLQQGRFSADVVYFYGEDSNLTALFGNSAPPVPAGYGFDYVNADALIHALKVTDGRITTPGGVNYRVLALDPNSRHMSLPVLRAIHALVAAGAVVCGPKPDDDPSLAGDPAEFQRLSDLLFGDGTGVHRVGAGSVHAGKPLAETLGQLQVAPDFDVHGDGPVDGPRSPLQFVHRRLADGELYFVDNRSDHAADVEAVFRVAGRRPELWRAETGQTEPVSFKMSGGRTTVPLRLEAWGTVFIVFRQPTGETSRTVPVATDRLLATVAGPWTLSFPPNRGAPPSVALGMLSSWTTHPDPGVRYFSGTGTYTKTLEVPAAWLARGSHVWLDLGEVQHLAQVAVNGHSLGQLWHAPYRVDLSPALKVGRNELSITVTNAWVNRLIGDQQANAAVKYTFTPRNPYKADSPLLPSGLLGPVTLHAVEAGG